MEISEIANNQEVEERLNRIINDLILILCDTEIDLYTYFQGMKELQKNQVECPKCGLVFDRVETGIDPQKTMEDWTKETRSEPKSKTFEEMRTHIQKQLKVEIVNLIINIRRSPQPVEQQINQLAPAITSLGEIAKILADLNSAIQHAHSDQEIIQIMKEALEDIRTKVIEATT